MLPTPQNTLRPCPRHGGWGPELNCCSSARANSCGVIHPTTITNRFGAKETVLRNQRDAFTRLLTVHNQRKKWNKQGPAMKGKTETKTRVTNAGAQIVFLL